METMPIVNKVESSGLLTIDLEQFFPKGEFVFFDLKPFLFMEMIVKEKEFRAALLAHDWAQYANKNVAIGCSADAIIPMWAYMLVSSNLAGLALTVGFGKVEQVQQQILVENIGKIDASLYNDARVVVKGCGDLPIGEAAYIAITNQVKPVAKSLMYGEPCSTVPVYKKKTT
jgi:hypothetical protein